MSIESKLYKDAVKVYKAMHAESEVDNEGQRLWTGSTVTFVGELGVEQSRYSHVMRLLRTMECVEMIRRGANTQPSIWVLYQEPTPELYEKTEGERWPSGSKGKASLEQHVRDLAHRVGRIEDKLRM